MYRTLVHALGISPARIDVHLMTKGAHPGASAPAPSHRRIRRKVDHRARPGLPHRSLAIVPGAEHGWAFKKPGCSGYYGGRPHHFLALGQGGPEGCLMLNACHHEPVATRILAHLGLMPAVVGLPTLMPKHRSTTLAVLGTMGDLSVNVSWQPPFPDLTPEVKKWTKKRLGSAIALLNAPRRTPEFDVPTAWSALLASTSPLTILDPATNEHAARLYAAREAVLLETERCTHTPPKFTKDGRIALLRITSSFQVHPSIATSLDRRTQEQQAAGRHVCQRRLYRRQCAFQLSHRQRCQGEGRARRHHPAAARIGVPPDTKRSPAKKAGTEEYTARNGLLPPHPKSRPP
ncbi:hypothetical protein L1887_51870 [Cichorium endivia]|nr:hypothetical protein L1887_51870 [Cichorium endivia]